MSIDWSGYTGEDKGYKSVKSGKQYVSEKTITDVWRYLHENNKYWVIDGISFTKEKAFWGIDFSRILYLNGSFVKTGEHAYKYTEICICFMLLAILVFILTQLVNILRIKKMKNCLL